MRTRIISALVGLVIVFAVLFFHNTIVLPIAVAVIIGIMLYELLRAVKMHKCLPVLCAVELGGVCVPILYDLNMENIIFPICLVSVFAVFLTWLRNHKEYKYDQIMFSLACMVLIPNSMTTLVKLDRYHESYGIVLLILGLAGAWLADSGAYFTGVAIGKHKLCPEISPKKTIEGFVGGILTNAVLFVAIDIVYSRFFADRHSMPKLSACLVMAVAGAVCGVVGTIGDLSASMIKRQIGFKDYGNIMPGHGGMMDRFDSVLFVAPTFYAFISLVLGEMRFN
ncbi:MAG: phosphatidate cytidylyltransferase [Ruminococcus sp.]|nr:phosphatidate cytidylyltransferase [Ruminococcus sp.]